MRARLLYADPATSQVLASLSYEELGRVDNGVWVACPDDAVRALVEKRPPVFLYFDRGAYDTAVADLSPAKVQEVIRKRRDRWAPQAKGYVMAWLLELERVSLEGTLRVADQRPSQGVLAQAEKSLTLLQRLYGLDRYSRAPAKAMAITVLEGEALLLAALQSGLDTGVFEGSQDEKAELSTHLYQRKGWAQALCAAAANLGAREFANSLPYADVGRGLFVHPADPAFEQGLLKRGEPAVRWRDGVVCVAPDRRRESLQTQGRSLEMLYADASEFYSSVDALTQAQLQRDFAARLERPVAATRLDIRGHIDRLHLYQILMKRALRERADAAQACESAGFERVLREDLQVLARSLARTHTFSRSQGLDSTEPALALFQAAEEIESGDLSLFGAIAARYWPDIAPGLKEIEKLKTGEKGR